MPSFPDDDLDPAWCHGDLSLQLCADTGHRAARAARHRPAHPRRLQVRWRIDGSSARRRPSGTPRNLMGFKDGIANPDTDRRPRDGRLVWVGSSGVPGSRDWAAAAIRSSG
jgi:deferrochelatase/peroxidase EfeB